jgi:hypothetical protein
VHDGELACIEQFRQTLGAVVEAEVGVGIGIFQDKAGILAAAGDADIRGAGGDIIAVASGGDKREAVCAAAQEDDNEDGIFHGRPQRNRNCGESAAAATTPRSKCSRSSGSPGSGAFGSSESCARMALTASSGGSAPCSRVAQ